MGAGERLFHLVPPVAPEGTPRRTPTLLAAAGCFAFATGLADAMEAESTNSLNSRWGCW